ncbi:MAG: dihydrolipoyl dehydrogenase [Thermogutta sp.]|nr:dihydrolipoyl dehydrogenase [Thermogutta sp.]
METELVVIGGGPGGYAAAFLAADLGMQVVLVDQEPRLGGVCLLRGCIPSKALLHVAKAMAEVQHLGEWGVRYASPKIEASALRSRKNKVISTLTGGLAQLAKNRGVQVVQARARFENARRIRLGSVDGKAPRAETLAFRHCIIAVGSRPTVLPLFAGGGSRVMDSTAALELEEVPERLLVVGGGYIGLELGTVYSALGSKVSVVEVTDGLLPGADRDLVRPLHKRLERTFEAIRLETKVVGLEETTDGVRVTLEGADGTKTETYSRILVSVGRTPNTDGLGLENTKVAVSDRGYIVVDAQRRTAEPGIWAIGDVVGQPMLAHKAAHEGKVAVEAILGHTAVFEPRAIPAVVFTDPEIAWAGLTETQAQATGIPYETAAFPWVASGRAQAVGRTEGLTKWLVDPRTERVLGCGIVGPNAGDLISEGVLAIEMGAVLRDIADTIHPHPTLSETLAFAAEVYFGTATDLYRPRSGAGKE